MRHGSFHSPPHSSQAPTLAAGVWDRKRWRDRTDLIRSQPKPPPGSRNRSSGWRSERRRRRATTVLPESGRRRRREPRARACRCAGSQRRVQASLTPSRPLHRDQVRLRSPTCHALLEMSFDSQEMVVLDCCLIHGFTRGLIWTMRAAWWCKWS
jgi:hypothetical protein